MGVSQQAASGLANRFTTHLLTTHPPLFRKIALGGIAKIFRHCPQFVAVIGDSDYTRIQRRVRPLFTRLTMYYQL